MYVLLTHPAGKDGAHDLDESCAIAWRADRITMGSERIPEAVLQLPQRRVGKQSYRHGGCPERQGVPAGDKVQVRSLEGGSRPWTRRRNGDCLTEEQRVIRHQCKQTRQQTSYKSCAAGGLFFNAQERTLGFSYTPHLSRNHLLEAV